MYPGWSSTPSQVPNAFIIIIIIVIIVIVVVIIIITITIECVSWLTTAPSEVAGGQLITCTPLTNCRQDLKTCSLLCFDYEIQVYQYQVHVSLLAIEQGQMVETMEKDRFELDQMKSQLHSEVFQSLRNVWRTLLCLARFGWLVGWHPKTLFLEFHLDTGCICFSSTRQMYSPPPYLAHFALE